MKKVITLVLALFLGIGAVFANGAGATPPMPAQMVTDLSGVLTAQQRSTLGAQLKDFEAKSGATVIVWIDKSLGGEPIEDFANRAFQAWGVGKKGVDRGAVYFVFTQDRRSRVEVGRGLEPILTDGTVKAIQAERARPHFLKGDWAGGIQAATGEMMRVIDAGLASEKPEAPSAAILNGKPNEDAGPTGIILLSLLALAGELWGLAA